MTGEVLKRLIASRQGDAEGGPPEDGEEMISLAWGFLRGQREQSPMFEVRCRNGKREAFRYSWLEHAVFDPSEGIILQFGRKTVRITGRNLNAEIRPNLRLFDSILRHRVPWIREAGAPEALAAPKQAVVIEQVRLE